MSAKRRYDAKRKGDPERLRKERARNFIREARRKGLLQSLGGCSDCKATDKKTVWHHPNYDFPNIVTELCYRCHRKVHPRTMPHELVVDKN